MNIDFTGQIKEMKEKDVLHKPFPTSEGFALFARKEEGGYVRVLFSSEEQIKKYLNDLGYDWGNEGKDEFTHFDNQNRLLTVLPELSEVDSIAADPQWDPDRNPTETVTKHTSDRTMEDIKHCAVELREVDHSVTPVSNHPAHNEKLHASSDESEEKKSKSKDYSELYRKVADAEYGGSLKVGDNVKNINKKCTHYGSEGVIKKFNDIPGDKGVTIAYKCTNAGKNWNEGDVLDKTPDQLEKKD